MTNKEFYILLSLASGPKHGYQIMKHAISKSNDSLKLRPGSLYGTIDRLLKNKLISEEKTVIVQGRKRKYYQLTETGLVALKSELENYQYLVMVAKKLSLI